MSNIQSSRIKHTLLIQHGYKIVLEDE